MLKARTKTIIFALLLSLSGSQLVRAEIQNYRYDGNMPFVKMMLSMMSAMGILDRVPNGLYGGYGGYPGLYGTNYNNPYTRALAMRGLSPLSSLYGYQNPYLGNYNSTYRNNPFLSSPWLQTPWSQSGLNTVSPVWGSPSWGVLPLDSYARNYNPWNEPVWSSTDLTGWVNEPWETSSWNPKAESSTQTQQPSQSLPSSSPLIQIYNSTNESQQAEQQQTARTQQGGRLRQPGRAQQSRPYNASPLSKLVPPEQQYGKSRPFAETQQRPPQMQDSRPPGQQRRQQSSQQPSQQFTDRMNQKPCITDFCGLKKPDLTGLWVAQDGEMLGINNKHRFLWSNGTSRYLTGEIKIQNEYLLAKVDDHEQLMRFKYKLAGDHLLTLQPDGVIREFVRMPVNQYQGYGQNYSGY